MINKNIIFNELDIVILNFIEWIKTYLKTGWHNIISSFIPDSNFIIIVLSQHDNIGYVNNL